MRATAVILWSAAVMTGMAIGSVRADPAADPLRSVAWPDIQARYFAGAPIVFDDRVKVSVPSIVENQAQVPVTVDARGLAGVRQVVVITDLNPIQKVLTLTPVAADAFIAFRMKVEQGTPVRAAALTSDGVWHIGGVYLDAAGGGCSAPAVARGEANWSETVGRTQGRVWRNADGSARVGLRIRHPMDTGLARDNTPAFFIERLDLRSPSGVPLAGLELFEPVSEDPTLTLEVRLPVADTALIVTGRDNNGGEYHAKLPAGWRQSALPSAESATR
ncbi:MAG: quinoprotein dehydrogenase-associated SoxYZ-like carrier [Hyphomicrobiaceae bacterium]|nr:quinoprotein dehydrogenase-associated SoxYZ-like carrier [Hyphomicrobiaceae bacterium]